MPERDLMRSKLRTILAVSALAVLILAVTLVFENQSRVWVITGLTVLPLAWSALTAVYLWWLKGRQADASTPTTPAEAAAAAEWLAGETAARWRLEAADRHITTPAAAKVRWHWAPEAVSVTAAEAAVPLPPGAGPAALPGTGPPAAILSSGLVTKLHDEVYARLTAGRLVLTGGPGAGKTGAMILLLLAALDWRDRQPDGARSRVPVPAWLTLGGWNPAAEPLADWVVGVLNRDYPALRASTYGADAAATLLRTGRIALFLDGFDELPAELRTAALRRLNSEAGDLRVVLSSRPAEYELALRDVNLDNCAVIELRPIRAAEAAAYLLRGQAGPSRDRWQPLARYLEDNPDSVVAKALDNPLTLSMARDAYALRDPVALTEPGLFPAPDAVTGHLIDQFLVTAYKDERERARAIGWLVWIAGNMGAGQDLRWWDIAGWVPGSRLRLARGLLVGLVGCPLVTLLGWLTYRASWHAALSPGIAVWIAPGLAVGLGVGLLTGLYLRLESGPAAGTGATGWRAATARMVQGLRVASLLFAALLASGLPANLIAVVLVRQGSQPYAWVLSGLWIALFVLVLWGWRRLRGRRRPRSPQGRGPLLETDNTRVVSAMLAIGGPAALWGGLLGGTGAAVLAGWASVIIVLPNVWIMGLLWGGARGGRGGGPWALSPRWPRPAWLVPFGLLAFPLVIPRWVSGWVTPAADAPSATAMSAYRADRRSSVIYAGSFVVMLVIPALIFIVAGLSLSKPLPSVTEDIIHVALVLAWVAVAGVVVWCTAWLCSGQVPLVNLTQLVLLPSRGRVSFARLLDDAHRRQVLRQAGTVYQFRHAALQSRLACWPADRGKEAPTGSGSAASVAAAPLQPR
jgi:hypothetical protein